MNLLLSLILLKFTILVSCAPNRDPYKTCACGDLGHFVKIVGGKESIPHHYPWTVALTGYPQLGNFFCGATIISSRFLVSAGHCFYTKDATNWSFDKLRVKVGAHNLTDKDVLIVKPKAYKLYEGFTEENDIDAPLLDIALIELEEDLPVNEKMRPICIHSKYFNYHINDLKSNQHFFNRSKRDVLFDKRNFFSEKFYNLFRSSEQIDDDEINDPLVDNVEFDQQNELGPIKLSKKGNKKFNNQPTDSHKIILDHPDKDLIKQVVSTVDDYYLQIRNDPIKIFDPAKELAKDKLTVVGWGSTDRYDLSVLPDVLMETDITQKNSEICENAYGDDVFFRSKMICANDVETDSCNGDSGGPLMTRSYGRMNLYGVVSYGRACGSYSSPGVYTRLSAFLSWILLHTVESKFCPN